MATLVVNELLMYVISKLDVDNVMDIRKVIIRLYGEEAVNDAKVLYGLHIRTPWIGLLTGDQR